MPDPVEHRAHRHEQLRLVQDVREGMGRGAVQGHLGADADADDDELSPECQVLKDEWKQIHADGKELWKDARDAERDERYPVDGGVFDVPAGSDEVFVAIDAKVDVRTP